MMPLDLGSLTSLSFGMESRRWMWVSDAYECAVHSFLAYMVDLDILIGQEGTTLISDFTMFFLAILWAYISSFTGRLGL